MGKSLENGKRTQLNGELPHGWDSRQGWWEINKNACKGYWGMSISSKLGCKKSTVKGTALLKINKKIS